MALPDVNVTSRVMVDSSQQENEQELMEIRQTSSFGRLLEKHQNRDI